MNPANWHLARGYRFASVHSGIRPDPQRKDLAILESVVPAHCIVASNTSGLRIADMMKGRSEGFRKRGVELGQLNLEFVDDIRLVVGGKRAGVDGVNQVFGLFVADG